MWQLHFTSDNVTLIATDGYDTAPKTGIGALVMAPGETYDVIMSADYTGALSVLKKPLINDSLFQATQSSHPRI